MVVRGGGITLFRKATFGGFFRNPDGAGLPLHDEASGLSVDPSGLRRICLLQGSGLPPSFELECDDSGFALAVWPDLADLAAVRRLASESSARPLPYEAVRRQGAAAWLDEIGPETRGWHHRLVFDREAETVSVAIRSASLAIGARFRPAFVDRDGSALRLSDAPGRHVLHCRAGSGADISPLSALAASHLVRP